MILWQLLKYIHRISHTASWRMNGELRMNCIRFRKQTLVSSILFILFYYSFLSKYKDINAFCSDSKPNSHYKITTNIVQLKPLTLSA